MSADKNKNNLKDHTTILNEIKGIPRQLRNIFVPANSLVQYLTNILMWRSKSIKRRAAFFIYKQYKDELPLSARKWSLRKIKIAINIINLKKKNKYRDRDNLDDNY